MIVLDTTVLVYAVGSEHPLADPCRRLVSAIGERRIRASTTPEVVQEFVHVRARQRDRKDAAALGRSYAQLLAPLLTVEQEDLVHGLRLFERHRTVGAFGAVLAALAVRREAEALISTDRAFAGLKEIRHIDPASADFDGLLEG